jgi:hypothetical protein
VLYGEIENAVKGGGIPISIAYNMLHIYMFLAFTSRGVHLDIDDHCRLHQLFIFAYMFLPKLLIFDLTLIPQNKLLRSFTFTLSRVVLHENLRTKKCIPIHQNTIVCLHGSQARVKSIDLGPKQQNFKIYFTLLCIFSPFFFCSQNIYQYT